MEDNFTANDTFGYNGSELPQEESNMFKLPWWQQTAWSLVFGLMVLTATGGNLIVIWIVLTHKRMRTVTNYFLVNLSLADTMVSTLNVVFNSISMLNGNWPFGPFYCKVSNFIAIVSVAASVFTLMAISIDRPIVPNIVTDSSLMMAGPLEVCTNVGQQSVIRFSTSEDVKPTTASV